MTKEEQWKREAEIKLDELDDRGFDFDNWSISDAYERGYCDCAEPREKRIAKLEEKISVLLSCKNCPENKGGYICAKEYENKCLAQKIEFIKELQKENAELKDEWQEQVQKANDEGYARTLQTIQLTKAKEILKSLYFIIESRIDYKNNIGIADEMWRAEQFWKGE